MRSSRLAAISAAQLLQGEASSGRHLVGRSFRKKSPNAVAFPHPQSRKDKYRNEDKPSSRGVVWSLVKRTVNVTDYRDAQHDVNRANNRTPGGITHMQVLLCYWFFTPNCLA